MSSSERHFLLVEEYFGKKHFSVILSRGEPNVFDPAHKVLARIALEPDLVGLPLTRLAQLFEAGVIK